MTTPFQFGNISTNLKPSTISKTVIEDPLIVNLIKGDKPYYIFLMDGKPRIDRLKSIQSAINKAGIDSYVMVSAVNCKFNRADIKGGICDYVLANKSDWTKYINYNNKHCAGIMTFGSALYAVTKSTDVMPHMFYADQFFRPYFYLGHGFCGDYDTFIVPVDDTNDLYPDIISGKSYSNVNWRTRFFYKQLRVLADPNKWMPDLRPLVHHIIRTREESDELFRKNMGQFAVAYDTETTGLDVMRDKVVCLTITWDGENGYFIPWDIINKRLLAMNIDSCQHRITQNGKFDCKIMWSNGLPFGSCEPTDDTGQLAHAIHSDRKHGLKPLAIFHTYFGGYDLDLDKFKKQTGIERYDKIPFDILSKYAINDALATWRTYFVLDDVLTEVDKKFPNDKLPEWTLRKWYEDIMMPVYPDFIEMEYRGFYVDKEMQDKGQQALLKECEELKEKMAVAWNVDAKTFDFSSTSEVGKLFESLGWPCVERGKSGIYSTSDSCLTEWKRLGKPCMDELKQFRTDSVFLNTFMGRSLTDDKGWNAYIREDDDGQCRIHCNFLVNGTTSYRNIGKEPNLQQIPVHDDNAKYVMKMISVPSIEEYSIETDSGDIYKGIATDLLDTTEGVMQFSDIKEDTIILGYHTAA